ncbi:MAG: hypothetical protein ACO4BZ_11815 [Ilumatobacteraceae bacterium]
MSHTGRLICHDDTVLFDTSTIDLDAFAAATGWEIKPEGACKGDVCVPLGSNRDALAIAERLGMAVVTDDATGQVAIGPASLSGHALDSAEAPDVVLHDLDGNEVALSQFRGEKVVIVSWAPY